MKVYICLKTSGEYSNVPSAHKSNLWLFHNMRPFLQAIITILPFTDLTRSSSLSVISLSLDRHSLLCFGMTLKTELLLRCIDLLMFCTLWSLSPWIDEDEFIEEAMVWYGFSLGMSTALFLAISTNFRNLKSAELNGSCVWLCPFVTTLSSIILHVLRQLDVFCASTATVGCWDCHYRRESSGKQKYFFLFDVFTKYDSA